MVSRQAIAVILLLAGGAVLIGHHSFPSYYFEDQMVTITGELVEFDYRAPHAWVKVRALDAKGVEQVFAAELDALRANKNNTDSSRRVRFLPYGIAVSVLDAAEASPGAETE